MRSYAPPSGSSVPPLSVSPASAPLASARMMSTAVPLASAVSLAEATAAFETSTPTPVSAPVTAIAAVSSQPLPAPRSRTEAGRASAGTASGEADASARAVSRSDDPSSAFVPEKHAPWALTVSGPVAGVSMTPVRGKRVSEGEVRGRLPMIRRFFPTPGETSTRPKARASSLFTARLITSLRPMTMSVVTSGWRTVIASARACVAFGASTTAQVSPGTSPLSVRCTSARSATGSAPGASAATFRASSRRSLYVRTAVSSESTRVWRPSGSSTRMTSSGAALGAVNVPSLDRPETSSSPVRRPIT
ncbi:Uncharacterised protein [Mycobacteroides abscessus subsp. abscessus]|nr:Uncharacterised protein [Mycobacteroides abscessus subsp. abscessus]